MGRPTKYSKELVANICIKIANGKSLREICRATDMPALSSIFLWLTEYTAFSEQYARAKEEQSELFADEIVEIADNEPDPQRARVKIDARKWVASKLKPKKYGDKITTEHIVITYPYGLNQIHLSKIIELQEVSRRGRHE